MAELERVRTLRQGGLGTMTMETKGRERAGIEEAVEQIVAHNRERAAGYSPDGYEPRVRVHAEVCSDGGLCDIRELLQQPDPTSKPIRIDLGRTAGPIIDDAAFKWAVDREIAVCEESDIPLLLLDTIHTDCAALGPNGLPKGMQLLRKHAVVMGGYFPDVDYATVLINKATGELDMFRLNAPDSPEKVSLTTAKVRELVIGARQLSLSPMEAIEGEINRMFPGLSVKAAWALARMFYANIDGANYHHMRWPKEHCEQWVLIGRGLGWPSDPRAFVITADPSLPGTPIGRQMIESLNTGLGLAESNVPAGQAIPVGFFYSHGGDGPNREQAGEMAKALLDECYIALKRSVQLGRVVPFLATVNKTTALMEIEEIE